MKCVICEERKPRRYCPGVRGEICTICCGTERENTVDCPFDCVYLREARAREKPNEFDASAAASIPFSDIRVPDGFLRQHENVSRLVADAVVEAVFATPGAIDYDLREALEALIRTYKTLQSGLVYETRPSNPLAANIYQRVQAQVDEGRKQIASKTGVSVRDTEVMGVLLIMQRQEYRHNNGRKRGRAYIDTLRQYFPDRAANMNPSASPLIV
jgi:hypothetical protein